MRKKLLFLEGFLPTLALIIFTALLPQFCMAMASMEGHANLGKMQGSAFVKFYRFQFVWVRATARAHPAPSTPSRACSSSPSAHRRRRRRFGYSGLPLP